MYKALVCKAMMLMLADVYEQNLDLHGDSRGAIYMLPPCAQSAVHLPSFLHLYNFTQLTHTIKQCLRNEINKHKDSLSFLGGFIC